MFVEGGKVRLVTRNGHDWTHRYGALARPFEQLPCKSAILDGEVVVQDPRGVTSINLLEQALSEGDQHAFTYFAFDLVYLDGFDLSGVKLVERKAALEGLVAPLIDERSAVQLSEHVEGDGDALFAQASRLGLEGIVSKKADARYVQARSPTWVKVKRVEIADFVAIGFMSNMPKAASSLIVAEERDGELVYACRVGSGIGDAKARELYAMLSKREIRGPVVPVPKTPGAHWVEPAWTVQIGYRSRSSQDAPRAPVFMGISARKAAPPAATKPRLIGDRELAAIHLTNPEREMFAGSGVTKLDLAIYYARVGDWLLPELHAPAGDGDPLPDRRHQGSVLSAPRLRRPAAGRRHHRSRRRGGPRRLHHHHRAEGLPRPHPVRRGGVPPLGLPDRRSGASGPPGAWTSTPTRRCRGPGSATGRRC